VNFILLKESLISWMTTVVVQQWQLQHTFVE
jgi:hypothetical protein